MWPFNRRCKRAEAQDHQATLGAAQADTAKNQEETKPAKELAVEQAEKNSALLKDEILFGKQYEEARSLSLIQKYRLPTFCPRSGMQIIWEMRKEKNILSYDSATGQANTKTTEFLYGTANSGPISFCPASWTKYLDPDEIDVVYYRLPSFTPISGDNVCYRLPSLIGKIE